MEENYQSFIAAKKRRSRRNRIAFALVAVAAFVTTYALILPGIAWEKSLSCGLEEHTHTEACYQNVNVLESKELVCTAQEHQHSDACYIEEKVLKCEDESAEHEHTDACYETVKTLNCGLEEHGHADECYVIVPAYSTRELVCTLEEHQHSDACYDFQADDAEYFCGNPSHSHSLACLSNPDADVETAQDWEGSFASVQLSGNWDVDVLAIAATQFGYEESSANFSVDADGSSTHGYTRYGAWAGKPYAKWNAIFVSFVLNYAQVTGMPVDDDCQDWLEALIALDAENAAADAAAIAAAQEEGDKDCLDAAEAAAADRHVFWHAKDAVADAETILAVSSESAGASELAKAAQEAGLYVPSTGDLIFIDWDAYENAEQREADQVGIVTEFRAASAGKPAYVVSIENHNGKVDYVCREFDDATIMGYAALPQNSEPEAEVESSLSAAPMLASASPMMLGAAPMLAAAPSYSSYITPSGSTNTSVSKDGLKIDIKADAATSQLESLFSGKKADDGKVVTDKSVVYKDDDYNAISSYGDNEFGVTLSALAQDYSITDEMSIQTPLDVVLVIDTSGSMISTTYDEGTAASIMVKSLNYIIDYVQNLNPNNRVGVACFSGNSYQLLPLGRYKVTGTASGATPQFFPEGKYDSRDTKLAPNSNLVNEDGSAVSGKGSFTAYWGGTYTQAGIAQGSKILENESSITVSGTVSKGDLTANYTAKRRPIILLLSDGEPTYCCSDYADVLNSKTMYGSGSTDKNNNKGILGYYTIMTAASCKQKISEHYQTDAYFYSVGIGINASGTSSKATSAAGDDYKRAVLNPTAENVSSLNSCSHTDTQTKDNVSTTCRLLYNLLSNKQSTSTNITISNFSRQNYGERLSSSSNSVPVKSNPFTAAQYAYADGAYFADTISSMSLTNAFKAAIDAFQDFPVYSFLLQKNSSVTVSDPIGDGMEVKAGPVLRYGGVNYNPVSSSTTGNVTTYKYSGTYTDAKTGRKVDISSITATVEAVDGLQTVSMIVPDSALPTYTAELDGSGNPEYYYEMLPVRLIYKVGLTDASQTAISNLTSNDAPLTFYTNRYTTTVAEADYKPTNYNSYFSAAYDTSTVTKAADVSETGNFVRKYAALSTGTNIAQNLGNNGVLSFTATGIEIPVQKVWDLSAGASTPTSVTVALYKKTSTGAVEAVKDSSNNPLTLTLSANTDPSKNWKGVFEDVPAPGTGETYYVLESAISGTVDKAGFVDTYSNPASIVLNGVNVSAGQVDTSAADMTITITNYSGNKLPKTGGIGTNVFYIAGAGLILLAGLILIIRMRKKRK